MLYKKLSVRILSLVCALLILVIAPVGVLAATDDKKQAQKDISSEVTQSYDADPAVQVGMIVKLKDKDPKTVEPLKSENSDKLLGVVVPAKNATIVLTPKQVTKQQVLVTNTGNFEVIVSNQNGPIKVGDYIMVSAVAGVGMKADETSDAQVIGKAAGDFSGNANVIGTVELKDAIGGKKNVSLGRVSINLAVSHNPLFVKNADYVPAGLSKVAQAVSDKPVSAARIYLGLMILLIAAFVTASVVYSGVRSGMISVGRNPLSKGSIIKSLIQTVIAGLIIFIVGIFAVYLLLKL
jgi:hypothetical protein